MKRSRRHAPLVVAMAVGGLCLAGCTGGVHGAGKALVASTSTASATTVTVVSTTTAPEIRSNLTTQLTVVQNFLTGAVWAHGKIPSPTDYVSVPFDVDDIAGALVVAESVGNAQYSISQTVAANNIGSLGGLTLTVRSTSSDPKTIVDVMHRPTNDLHDYLLTGDAFRAVAPTSWVTVPAQFGDGVGCALPGRQAVCEVVADLQMNQKLDRPLPTNIAIDKGGVGTVTSAITVRQLMTLKEFRLHTAAARLMAKAKPAELDSILIPVTLNYSSAPGDKFGAPTKMSVTGQLAVAGTAVKINLSWTENIAGLTADLDLPVPTRALYTPLNSAQAARLVQLENQSE